MYATEKYCIIGAGPAGITAAKNLKGRNIAFDVIERESAIGGNWWFEHPNSAICHSTRLISSKTMSHFKGFPMPDSYPDFPRHDLMCEYIRSYARHFGIEQHIQFNTSVEWVERTDDGLWDVSLNNGEKRRYKGLILANGHLWDCAYPDFAGTFAGQSLHSKQYKTPEILKGKRVLVVGAGNSGCDIAVEAALHAEKTFHSTRRGYYYIPKFVFGIPVDKFSETAYRLRVPLRIRQISNSLLLWFYWGSPSRYGLPKPDHRILETHPIVNSQLLYFVRHGDIIPKPNIQELRGDSVQFEDGSTEQIDLIIYATGFNIRFPFIDQKHMNWGEFGPQFYLHAFHPDYDNLFVVGLLQPDSGIFHLMDRQAELIASFIEAQTHRPEKAAAFHQIKAGEQPDIRGGVKHLQTQRHFLEINHAVYERQLNKLIRDMR